MIFSSPEKSDKKKHKSTDNYGLNGEMDDMLQKKSLFLKNISKHYPKPCQKIKLKN